MNIQRILLALLIPLALVGCAAVQAPAEPTDAPSNSPEVEGDLSTDTPTEVEVEGELTTDAAASIVVLDGDNTFELLVAESTMRWTGNKVVGAGKSGTIDLKSGSLVVENGSFAGGEFVADMTTISHDEGNEGFEDHLKNEDFFAVDQFPEASFTITDIQKKDSGYQVKGLMTIKDQTHELNFPATIVDRGGKLSAQASFEIDRTKWGITYNSGSIFKEIGDRAILDEVPIELDLVFQK